jgi:hypothetical protein
MTSGSRAGFHIGSVGGNFSNCAGGDIVAGDKVTNTGGPVFTNGFRQEQDKQQFAHDIDKLRTILRAIQKEIQQAADIGEDDKDKVSSEVLQHVLALRKANEDAAGLPVGQETRGDQAKGIALCLKATESLLDKLNELGAKAIQIGTAVGPCVERALPLLLSARTLFGVP